MKYIVAFSFLLLSATLHSQNKEWDNLISTLKLSELSITEFDQLMSNYSKVDDVKLKLERELYSIAIQRIYQIENKTKDYYLNVFIKNKQIIYTDLVEQNTGDNIINKSTEDYELAIKEHFDKWNIKFNEDHKYFNPTDKVVVGFGCGFAPFPPKKFYEIEELVEQNNIEELLNWCKSINPEIRCYGGMGLHYLNKKGKKTGEDGDRILKLISKDKTEMYTCSGCIYGIRETVKKMYRKGKRELKNRMK